MSLNPVRAKASAFLLGFAMLASGGCASVAVDKQPQLRLIGETTLPHGALAGGTPVGGFSGIDYDAKREVFYLLSDDRSEHAPARFYTVKLRFNGDAVHPIEFESVQRLRQADGSAFPSAASATTQNAVVPDPEAIRYLAASDTLIWSSEGDRRRNLPPFVREMRRDGSFVREMPTLPMFRETQDPKRGPRNNLSFEGLAVSSDGKRYWTAMEAPLLQDGPIAGVKQAPGLIRFTEHDLATGDAIRQLAYQADALPHTPQPPIGFADNGVSEIVQWDADRLLVVERAYAMGVGNSIRLYLVDTRTGSNVLKTDSLVGGGVEPVKKTLLMNLDQLNLLRLDNIEAACFGPRLPNGRRSLVLASDDNFNRRQINQFLVFEVIE